MSDTHIEYSSHTRVCAHSPMYHLSPGRLVGSEEGWTDNVGAYEGSMLFAGDGSELVVSLAVGAADSDGTIVGPPVGFTLGVVDGEDVG